MSYKNIPEEELKNKIAKDIFWQFDCTKIIGKVDFCVALISSNKNVGNANLRSSFKPISMSKVEMNFLF